MKVRIMPMEPDHLDQVTALEKICVPEDPWSRRVFEDSLANESSAALLARTQEGELLGYIFFTVVLDEGSVDNIAVAPAARRQGIAEALMNACHQLARQRGAAFLLLEVRPSNRSAAALYEKLGYREIGRRKDYYDAPKEDAIVMRLELTTCT